jgi:histidinol-phosphate aminotransferase
MQFPFRPELASLKPYPPGKPIEEVQREQGISEVTKLASNENPYGPSPLAVAAITAHLSELHLYPESGCYYLRKKLADKLGVPENTLMFGIGSDEIVALMTTAFLDCNSNIVCSEHTFVRYEMGAMAMGAEVRRVPLKNWQHDVDAILREINPATRMVFIANPENPVGAAIPSSAVRRLVEGVPAGVILVLDEAYYEFARDWADYPESIAWLPEFPNLVITRTFSKAYGLAGLRVGFAVGNPDIWNIVDRIRPPFNVSRIAQEAALAALDDTEHLAKTVTGNRAGLDYLYAELEKLGLEYVPSHANFVLVDMKRPALPVYESLLRHGVIVRPMGIYNLPEHLRISVGLPAENKILVEALTRVLHS